MNFTPPVFCHMSHYLVSGNPKCPALKMSIRIVLFGFFTKDQVSFLKDVLGIGTIWQQRKNVGIKRSLNGCQFSRIFKWNSFFLHIYSGSPRTSLVNSV